MDSATKDEMQPSIPPGRSPSGWTRGGMVAKKMALVGLGPPCQVWPVLYRAARGMGQTALGGQARK